MDIETLQGLVSIHMISIKVHGIVCRPEATPVTKWDTNYAASIMDRQLEDLVSDEQASDIFQVFRTSTTVISSTWSGRPQKMFIGSIEYLLLEKVSFSFFFFPFFPPRLLDVVMND